jgi:hypothetical protein
MTLLQVCLGALCACSTPHPVRDVDADAQALDRAAALDSRTLSALREAEAAAERGDAARALAQVKTAVLPAAERAIAQAEGLRPRTGDGRAARGELVAVLELRRDAVHAWAEAIESRDDMRLLEALRKAREVEEALVEWESRARQMRRETRGGR